ncbi:MAG TPA: dipeptidase [Gemmatimonadales bacterium]|jgi:acetylornithine deacetylase/succinyl-diaminopimelate desuccinylase-like protein|nr:dipeptidase [Gemmatimonadales bacterium]
MDTAFVAREQDRMLRELTEFLSIPSVSALPDHAADCRRAADWLMQELRRLGCPVVTLVEGQGHPVVWAEGPQLPGRPTLLIYGHYDVQPPDPLNEWSSPPFEPTVREGRLYARGAADDKGQVFCLLKAYEASRGADGHPPLNVHFIFEGEEECGGRVVFDLLRAEPERTRADAVLVCDMSYFAPGWPAVYTALRGLCYAEISVRTLQRDLHSGTYGGAAPNALETLVRLLADLKDEDGKIHVRKLYKAVEEPSRSERKAWKQLPFDEERFLTEEVTGRSLTGLEDYSVLERVWALPTFEIHGIKGGFTGEGAKTVIPAQASAKVSLRLVPGQRFEKVARQLRKAVARFAPKWADVDVRVLHGGDPVQVDVESPAFELLDQAFEEVVGRKAVQARAGGSIPIVPELGLEGAPVILTGIGLPDDGLHSPNEKLDLSQLWSGIRIFARFFELLGATDPAVMARDEEEDAEDDEEDTGEEEPSEAAAADQAAAR